MKKNILLTLFLFLASCSYNIIPVTKDTLPPYQGKVAIYMPQNNCMPAGWEDVLPTDYSEILPANYTVIATLTYYNWGKFRRVSVAEVATWFREDAQKLGANAIVIDSCNIIYSGYFSKGKDITGRAIFIK
jgi:hypothetical protein